MDQDRITQAQSEYAELLKLSILYEETILSKIKDLSNDELTEIQEGFKSTLKQREEVFMKKYADLILQGVTFNHNLNVISSNQSL